MKIALINLTGGGISGGYEKYLRHIIPRLATQPEVGSVLCITPHGMNAQEWFPPLPQVSFGNCSPYRPFHTRADSGLIDQLKQFNPDVLFIPTERYMPFGDVPVVNMVQNMEQFVRISQNTLFAKMRNSFQRIIAARAVRRAQRNIAVSHFVKNTMVMDYHVDSKKMNVIYYGIDPIDRNTFFRPACVPQGWEKRFLFTAGSIRPPRGLEDLLHSFSRILHSHPDIAGLVIAGEASPYMQGYKRALQRWTRENGLEDRICWAGHLGKEELGWCYTNSLAFIMTSRVESFGMVALEGLAHGCVCISADNPCLPEIFGDSAHYYTSGNAIHLAEVVDRVLRSGAICLKEMSEKAQRRAALFSWDVTVRKTVATLGMAIDGKEYNESSGIQ